MANLKRIYHFLLAWLGSALYSRPARQIFVLGVTGTKGKSTVVELINAILEASGKKTALLSSVRMKIGAESASNPTDNSMPGRAFIQRFLRKAVSVGCDCALIEVTSEGVSQYRHRFIDFDAALFLNLRPEHIEAHGSFERYREAKINFFRDVARRSKKKNKFFVINREDPASSYFVEAVSGRGQIFYFSREEFTVAKLRNRRDAIGDWLGNDFNLENAAAAARFAEAQGISWDTIKAALRGFSGLAGRMDVVQRAPFEVIVDYAHTPDSLESVYKTLSENQRPKTSPAKISKGNLGGQEYQKLICVFGSAGGGRDKWKRPVLGEIAAKYCGVIVLTNEDPYDENPQTIIKEIESGFSQILNYKPETLKIVDRRQAIQKAIDLAGNGDVVIITGKGSEHWIHGPLGKRESWDDRQAAKDALARRLRSAHDALS